MVAVAAAVMAAAVVAAMVVAAVVTARPVGIIGKPRNSARTMIIAPRLPRPRPPPIPQTPRLATPPASQARHEHLRPALGWSPSCRTLLHCTRCPIVAARTVQSTRLRRARPTVPSGHHRLPRASPRPPSPTGSFLGSQRLARGRVRYRTIWRRVSPLQLRAH